MLGRMFARSPFPGMDPWLEAAWGDVHLEIISRLAEQIADALPADLFVTVQERVYVLREDATDGGRAQQWIPDVGTFHVGEATTSVEPEAGGGPAVAEPVRITLVDGPVTEGYIEVRRLDDDRPLVTAVEVLSPTNKGTADGRRQYLRKRADYVRAGVNLMEVDLLRGGRHLIGVPAGRLRPAWRTPYKVAVRRGGRPVVDYYPILLRERLPRLRLPVGPAAADAVVIDLQRPIDYVYRRGRYGQRIDYARPPDPPLSADDASWAAERVAVTTAVSRDLRSGHP